ncbi:MAG: efflux RND transporter periplasmic adaptor subunit [Sterolibacterium sp.]|nr:efflux RND transporter periplasmic adaptor subunit [Sterolibacterium sp.]
MNQVKPGRSRWLGALLVLGLVGLFFGWRAQTPQEAAAPADVTQPAAAIKPALTVTVAPPQTADWPQTLMLDGNLVAWQEAVIGAELGQLRITEVLAQVGDRVRRGQVLARLDNEAIGAEREEASAMVTELDAYAEEARANAERAKVLREQGFYSPQTSTQFVTGERASLARVTGAQARLTAADWRLARTEIRASDDGVISARQATVGSLVQPGQELFRLIRQGRIEWQAEVPAQLIGQLQVGQTAQVEGPDGTLVSGRVRAVAPSLDARTRNGLVYVDLPTNKLGSLRAGMFVHGQIALGQAAALSVPAASVLQREGFAYVFVVAGEPSRASLLKVRTGRRQHGRVEILEGLQPGMQVVTQGTGFLTDNDVVSVVAAETAVDRAP